MYSVSEINEMGKSLKNILKLDGYPVGVKLVKNSPNIKKNPEKMRYCQAIMKARRGEKVYINKDNLVCPSASRAFGFRELPEGLKSGKGLTCFGIISADEVGKKMFENMPYLEMNQINHINVYPLTESDDVPDVIIVEDEVEKLMWIILSYLHYKRGERITGSTAVLQAACVDSTIIPYKEDRLNYSFGCYGCRDATDIKPSEAIIGFPANELKIIVEHLNYLSEKAMPNSRSKKTYYNFTAQKKR